MNVSEIRNTPSQLPVHRKQTRPAGEESFEAQLGKTVVTPAQINDGSHTITPAALTQPERDFFERLFPEAAEEVRTYNPYQRERSQIAVKLGTLVDRRG